MKLLSRKPLLEHMRELKTDAEGIDKTQVILPVRAHARALRPEIIVIEGGRGAGKSTLFDLTTKLGPKLPEFFNDKSLPVAQWVDCFSQKGMLHPINIALDALAKKSGDDGLRAFWMGHLLGRLAGSNISVKLPVTFERAYKGNETQPAEWIDSAEANAGAIAGALDGVERSLIASDQYVFATYDYLDRLGDLDVTLRRRLIRALLSLWLSLSSRYQKLRPKIFLRPDLFETARQDFADATKLRSRSQSLDWDLDTVFEVAVRHLANSGPDAQSMRAWFKDEVRISLTKGVFGYLPSDFDAEGRKRFVMALAGELMGSGVKKGYTWRWIPARLQDADGRIAPRSLLRLLGFAAQHALKDPMKSGDALLRPTDLVAAMAETSRERVNELREEYEVVRRLENLKGVTLLLDRMEAAELLGKPTDPTDPIKLSGNDVLDELARIGVVSIRSDMRIDVPDIYRSGFGIKRKGGARRPE